MSGYEIRNANDEELDIVASLAVDAYAEYAERMSPDAWSQFAQGIANVRGRLHDAEVLVAVDGDRIVGTVTLYTAWRGAQEDSYGVRLLAVPPPERGKGVGRELMEHCIERARSEGRKRVMLTTSPEMESARDLYERLGFERDRGLDHEPAPGVRVEGYALYLDRDAGQQPAEPAEAAAEVAVVEEAVVEEALPTEPDVGTERPAAKAPKAGKRAPKRG